MNDALTDEDLDELEELLSELELCLADAGMGIRFLYEDDAQRLLIEQTVEQLMVEHLGPRLYTKLIGKNAKDTV